MKKQEIDLEEKKKILMDILGSQPVQGNFNLQKCLLNESNAHKNNITIGQWPKKK